jgi:2-oxoglutarate ferredoxin oxidoreductase subunit gamma
MEQKESARFQVGVAGYGGQGILTIGKFLAEAGMSRYKHVVFFPSYGGAQRGGESTCSVTLSDEEIGALVPLNPSTAIIMSPEALQDLEKRVKPGSILFVDSSIVSNKVSRDDVKVFYIPATERALKLGDSRVAGFVLLGAYLEATKAIPLELMEKAIEKKLAGGKGEALLSLNKQALREGARLMRSA